MVVVCVIFPVWFGVVALIGVMIDLECLQILCIGVFVCKYVSVCSIHHCECFFFSCWYSPF